VTTHQNNKNHLFCVFPFFLLTFATSPSRVQVEENRHYRIHDHTYQEVVKHTVFRDSRSIFQKLKLAKGRYLILACTFDQGVEADFIFRIYTGCANDFKCVPCHMFSNTSKFYETLKVYEEVFNSNYVSNYVLLWATTLWWSFYCNLLLNNRDSGHYGPSMDLCIDYRELKHDRPQKSSLNCCAKQPVMVTQIKVMRAEGLEKQERGGQ